MMDNDKSILALVQLIDDPDDTVFEHVRDQLIGHGTTAIPFLENSWETEDYGLLFQSRIEDLIHEIQFLEVKNELQTWITSPNKDLLAGAIIISKYQYPNIEEQDIHTKIQAIRKDIWLEINDQQTAYEKVRVFNKVFYGKHRFTGNSKDYHSPENSYLYKVLDMHKGNPLSLSVLYSIIAQSLDMPIFGINLPNHFILSYLDENNTNSQIDPDSKDNNLFYINAFSRGGIFNSNEIDDFLKGLNKPLLRSYYEPCSNSSIIVRMLTNLITSFQQTGSSKKVNELIELRDLFDS